jgi:hypothetical protein
VETEAIECLQTQLLNDMERFGDLLNRVALGEAAIKAEQDQLEGAVEIKLAILEGLKRLQDEELYMVGVDLLMDEDMEVLFEEDIEEDEEW